MFLNKEKDFRQGLPANSIPKTNDNNKLPSSSADGPSSLNAVRSSEVDNMNQDSNELHSDKAPDHLGDSYDTTDYNDNNVKRYKLRPRTIAQIQPYKYDRLLLKNRLGESFYNVIGRSEYSGHANHRNNATKRKNHDPDGFVLSSEAEDLSSSSENHGSTDEDNGSNVSNESISIFRRTVNAPNVTYSNNSIFSRRRTDLTSPGQLTNEFEQFDLSNRNLSNIPSSNSHQSKSRINIFSDHRSAATSSSAELGNNFETPSGLNSTGRLSNGTTRSPENRTDSRKTNPAEISDSDSSDSLLFRPTRHHYSHAAQPVVSDIENDSQTSDSDAQPTKKPNNPGHGVLPSSFFNKRSEKRVQVEIVPVFSEYLDNLDNEALSESGNGSDRYPNGTYDFETSDEYVTQSNTLTLNGTNNNNEKHTESLLKKGKINAPFPQRNTGNEAIPFSFLHSKASGYSRPHHKRKDNHKYRITQSRLIDFSAESDNSLNNVASNGIGHNQMHFSNRVSEKLTKKSKGSRATHIPRERPEISHMISGSASKRKKTGSSKQQKRRRTKAAPKKYALSGPSRVPVLVPPKNAYIPSFWNMARANRVASTGKDNEYLEKLGTTKTVLDTVSNNRVSEDMRFERIRMWMLNTDNFDDSLDQIPNVSSQSISDFHSIHPLALEFQPKAPSFLLELGNFLKSGESNSPVTWRLETTLPGFESINWDISHLLFLTDTQNFLKFVTSILVNPSVETSAAQFREIRIFIHFLFQFLASNFKTISETIKEELFQSFRSFIQTCYFSNSTDPLKTRVSITMAVFSFSFFILFETRVTDEVLQNYVFNLGSLLASYDQFTPILIQNIRKSKELLEDEQLLVEAALVYTQTLNYFLDKRQIFNNISYLSTTQRGASFGPTHLISFLSLLSLDTKSLIHNTELNENVVRMLIRSAFCQYTPDTQNEHIHMLISAAVFLVNDWNYPIEKDLIISLFSLYSGFGLGLKVNQNESFYKVMHLNDLIPKSVDSLSLAFLKGVALCFKRLNHRISLDPQNSYQERADLNEINDFINKILAKSQTEYPEIMLVVLLLRQKYSFDQDVPLGSIIKFMDLRKLLISSDFSNIGRLLEAVFHLCEIQLNKRYFKEIKEWLNEVFSYLTSKKYLTASILQRARFDKLLNTFFTKIENLLNVANSFQRHWPSLLLDIFLKVAFSLEFPKFISKSIWTILSKFVRCTENLLNEGMPTVSSVRREKMLNEAKRQLKRWKPRLFQRLTLNTESTLSSENAEVVQLLIKVTVILDSWDEDISQWASISNKFDQPSVSYASFLLDVVPQDIFMKNQSLFCSRLIAALFFSRFHYMWKFLKKEQTIFSSQSMELLRKSYKNDVLSLLGIIITEIGTMIKSGKYPGIVESMLKTLENGLKNSNDPNLIQEVVVLVLVKCNRDLYYILPAEKQNAAIIQSRIEKAILEPSRLTSYLSTLLLGSIYDTKGPEFYTQIVTDSFCGISVSPRTDLARKQFFSQIVPLILTQVIKEKQTEKRDISKPNNKSLRLLLPCLSQIIFNMIRYEFVSGKLDQSSVCELLVSLVGFVVDDICVKENVPKHQVSWSIFHTMLNVTVSMVRYAKVESNKNYAQFKKFCFIRSFYLDSIIQIALYVYSRYVLNDNTIQLSSLTINKRMKVDSSSYLSSSKLGDTSGGFSSFFPSAASLFQDDFNNNKMYIIQFLRHIHNYSDCDYVRHTLVKELNNNHVAFSYPGFDFLKRWHNHSEDETVNGLLLEPSQVQSNYLLLNSLSLL